MILRQRCEIDLSSLGGVTRHDGFPYQSQRLYLHSFDDSVFRIPNPSDP